MLFHYTLNREIIPVKREKKLRFEDKNKKKANSIFGNYASALSIGLAIDINVIYNYTPFQLFDSIKRYTLKMAYDLYQKVATTPMMDVSKMDEPDNWMDGIY